MLVLVVSDTLAAYLLVAAWTVAQVVGGFQSVISPVEGWILPLTSGGAAQLVLALVFGMFITGTYGSGDRRRDPAAILRGAAIAVALVTWTLLWSRPISTASLGYILTLAVVGGTLAAERLLLDQVVRKYRAHGARTVFVGAVQECTELGAGSAFRDPSIQVLGFVNSSEEASAGALGHVRGIRQILLRERVESVVVCGQLDDRTFRRVAEAAQDAGCHLFAVPRTFRVTGMEPQMVWRGGQPLIEMTSPAVLGRDLRVKRMLDVVGGTLGCVVLLPVFLLVAIAIKIDSPGPVFYRSTRWGFLGSHFGMWKFRTMVSDARNLLNGDPELFAAYSENQKLEDDPRITRVGYWLRRTSIDELPQLFNVLTGDMSLVGPRPKLENESEMYGAAMDTVLSVRPGMTGLWQVSGRSSTTYEERVALDVKYTSHLSLWMDLEILARTLPSVLLGRGAQ